MSTFGATGPAPTEGKFSDAIVVEVTGPAVAIGVMPADRQKTRTELEMEAGRKAAERRAGRLTVPPKTTNCAAPASPFTVVEPMDTGVVAAFEAKRQQTQGMEHDAPMGEASSGLKSDQGRVSQAEITPDLKANATAVRPKFISPKFDRMPAELKQLNNWVLWVAIWNGSKWTKRPIQPSGYGASTTKPEHWSSFDNVKQAYERAVQCGYVELHEKDKPAQRHPVSGVGFVFDGQPDNDGLVYAGVDFDSGAFKDEVASFAQEQVKRLGSYYEASVSGTGVHVIVRAYPLDSGISHNGIELYTAGRFFTMTGRTPATTPLIIAAPVEFAALAEQVQARSRASSPGKGQAPAEDRQQAAGAEASGWFEKLPTVTQSQVVRYAALHIAKNSKPFELSKYGGSHQDYVKLTLAIARSGVPDAEDIFVEAASIAKEADSEDELRKFFPDCRDAKPHTNQVTVGTLLHFAHECGADFSQSKQIAARSGASIAVYEPGNEGACRKLLNQVVAADPRTFTLGDPAGPLVILRVRDKDTLPPDTRWEGDLPGTTLATPADVMQRAEGLEWLQWRRGVLVRTHPPRAFINDYLPQMRGQYEALPLRGIARVPYIDDAGEVHFLSGYDHRTGLFHDKPLTFDLPLNPDRNEARNWARKLLFPFSQYQFDDPVAGQAVVLAALLTAIERPFLPITPMFVIRSSMPGTGKGIIVRCLVRLAFDTAPVMITWGQNSEEFEKRLAALLLRAPAALSIDNANGVQIKGDLLESIITEGGADIRPLGHSEIVKVRSRPLITLTGNNPIITGDMARRSIPVDIIPRSADPERDRYPFNPTTVVSRHRARLLRAAYIIMRAFRLAGMPSQGLPAVGSFDDWSRHIRDLVYWVTDYDVSGVFHQNKAEDPRRQADAGLLAALHQHFGMMSFKAADAIAVHKKVMDYRRSPLTAAPATPAEQGLHEALEDVLGRDVNARLFGFCARRLNGAHNGGFMLETQHDPTLNANVITVRKT